MNGRPRGSLNIYKAWKERDPSSVRLICARSFAQCDSMIAPGWASKIATPAECYRLGRVGVTLEYYYPQKETA